MSHNRFAAVCLVIVIILAVGIGAGKQPRVAIVSAPQASACATDDPFCGLPMLDETDSASVHAYAIALLANLLGSGDASQPDAGFRDLLWMDWQTKCKVVGDDQICPLASIHEISLEQLQKKRDVPALFELPANSPIYIRRAHYPGVKLMASLRPPVQGSEASRSLLEAHRESAGTIQKKPLDGVGQSEENFASVLYNDEAAAGIANQWQTQTMDAGLTLSSLGAKSIIIKAVWQTLASNNNDGHGVQTPILTPSIERMRDSGMVNNTNGKLRPSAFRTVNLDVNSHEPACPSPAAPRGPVVAGQNCLRIYHNVLGLPSAVEQGSSTQILACSPSCDMALMGLQMMVRPNAGSPWIWLAMWWTGKPGNDLKASPWMYYTVAVTNQPRSTPVSDDGGQPNIVFNPYLEGRLDINGAVSNCLNCHLYAAYDKPAVPRFPPFFGATLLPDLGKPDPAPVLNKAYLQDGIATDQLWSRFPHAASGPKLVGHDKRAVKKANPALTTKH